MIPLPLSPKLIQKKGDKIGVFEIPALYPGYGTTVGNALRRVLLSSLEGAAITQVRIKGASHEFSVIKGIMEDVLTIILNLKNLKFKLLSKDSQRAKLLVKGAKKVKGSDFQLPTQLELMNPELHIAELTSSKSELDIEVQVEKGVGYEAAETRKRKLSLGEISVDAVYSPVNRVAFKVENMRVKDRTDFDKLIIEIETDGTIIPEQALMNASKILIDHFSLIQNAFEEKEEERSKSLKTPLSEFKLSKRTLNALLKNKIVLVEDILKKNKKDLEKMKGLGANGIKEIEKAVKKLGLELS